MKKYIKSSSLGDMTAKQYMDKFEKDKNAVKEFLDSHEADEDGIELDDTYVLFVRKDEDYPEGDHLDFAAYLYDGVYHTCFYPDGRVDTYMNV